MTTAARPRRAVIQRRHPAAADLVAVSTDLAHLAATQSGVVTRAQLRRHGWSDGQIAAAVSGRRWRGYGRYAVVLDNAPLTDLQQLWVAAVLPGKPCAPAGASGAALAGLRGFEPDRVHILVEHATHVRAPAWVTLHESRRFSLDDVETVHGLPSTRIARSIVDAATWSTHPRRACVFLCAAVQQRLTTPTALGDELRAARAVRHAAIMRAILGDIGGGGHTLAEIELAPLSRRAGLPPPRRQVLRREPTGRVRYIDAEFDLPDGVVLAVEIDGAVHLRTDQWNDDMCRQNEIVIGGRPVLRFSSLTVRLDDALVVDQLTRMRRAHTP